MAMLLGPKSWFPPRKGPATEPEMSMLLVVPLSFAIPVVAKETVPFKAVAAVIVKPMTCLATPKLPVPQVVFFQTTLVPPFSTLRNPVAIVRVQHTCEVRGRGPARRDHTGEPGHSSWRF
jgi:hypothetical protein